MSKNRCVEDSAGLAGGGWLVDGSLVAEVLRGGFGVRGGLEEEQQQGEDGFGGGEMEAEPDSVE